MTKTTVTDVMRWGRSGKGSVPITVSVLNFDPTLGRDSATFQPCSDRALSNLKAIGVFAKIFSFVQNLPPDEPRVFLGFLPRRADVRRSCTIFWDFTCRRATFRSTYNVGPN
ncbi:hypothetical protein EDB84DRAFT_366428 [Lactarius hengduanensis]|nr:hypothetical protein EDB84DRAFT_366428 [Lactarius hengduanensis]